MLKLNELLEDNKQIKIDVTRLSSKEFETKWSIQAGKYLEQLEELEQIQSENELQYEDKFTDNELKSISILKENGIGIYDASFYLDTSVERLELHASQIDNYINEKNKQGAI